MNEDTRYTYTVTSQDNGWLVSFFITVDGQTLKLHDILKRPELSEDDVKAWADGELLNLALS